MKFGNYDPAIATDFIAAHEGLVLKAYRCPAGVWTIGYGHTAGVAPGMVCTEDEAKQMLAEDLTGFAKAVADLVTVDVTAGQFIALLSFSYNCGVGALRNSTLLRLLNAGKTQEAAEQFGRWTRGGGKVLPGLVRRREMERRLFLGV